MYFLHRGTVEVLVGTPPVRVATLQDGSIFGEMALFGSPKRAATIRATEFCDCRVISHPIFHLMLQSYPEERRLFTAMARERRQQLDGLKPVRPPVRPQKPQRHHSQIDLPVTLPPTNRRISNTAPELPVVPATQNQPRRPRCDSRCEAEEHNHARRPSTARQPSKERDCRYQSSSPPPGSRAGCTSPALSVKDQQVPLVDKIKQENATLREEIARLKQDCTSSQLSQPKCPLPRLPAKPPCERGRSASRCRDPCMHYCRPARCIASCSPTRMNY